jgi:DNA helicase-2/ATP-dependent DNA helicase PcrA
MMAGFHESATADDAHTLAMRIAKESGLMQHVFSGHDPDDISKQENMQEMLDGIANFVQDSREQGLGTLLTDYLQEASLATDFDRNDIDKDDDSVNMMTIHSAKGLEFPIVFITGLEEGLFPSEMTSDSPRALEEERRLFYVAITRAERQVVLTYAKSRFRNGKMEYSRPSRFIREIPQQYYSPLRLPQGGETVQRQAPRVEQRLKPIRPQSAGSFIPPSRPSFTPPSAHSAGGITPSPSRGREEVGTALSVGTPVVHERFGRGIVQALEGTGIDAKATVQLENAGTKVLMLRFA